MDKAEDQQQIGKQFVPPMMDPVLGDYARNLPDARESEVLSLFATIINKYVAFFVHLFSFSWLRKKQVCCSCNDNSLRPADSDATCALLFGWENNLMNVANPPPKKKKSHI